ncbi:MAG: HAD-IB family hydrolase [Flavobacteriaceae bacterium]|nr:HAD-IB family hydrolase [Flavobacteriaceae bacterium]
MKDLPNNLNAAYFDVDGTLTKSNIVQPLIFIKKKTMPSFNYNLWKLLLPVRFVYWTILDKINRELATTSIYAQYKGISVEVMNTLKEQCYQNNYKATIFPKALETVNSLKEKGTKIVLVSGSLDLFLLPLAKELEADLLSSRLEVKDEKYTGKIIDTIVSGSIKSSLINEHAQQHQFELNNCASFGDSKDDIPMLSSVKYPVAVNPDKKLSLIANKNNWSVINWS